MKRGGCRGLPSPPQSKRRAAEGGGLLEEQTEEDGGDCWRSLPPLSVESAGIATAEVANCFGAAAAKRMLMQTAIGLLRVVCLPLLLLAWCAALLPLLKRALLPVYLYLAFQLCPRRKDYQIHCSALLRGALCAASWAAARAGGLSSGAAGVAGGGATVSPLAAANVAAPSLLALTTEFLRGGGGGVSGEAEYCRCMPPALALAALLSSNFDAFASCVLGASLCESCGQSNAVGAVAAACCIATPVSASAAAASAAADTASASCPLPPRAEEFWGGELQLLRWLSLRALNGAFANLVVDLHPPPPEVLVGFGGIAHDSSPSPVDCLDSGPSCPGTWSSRDWTALFVFETLESFLRPHITAAAAMTAAGSKPSSLCSTNSGYSEASGGGGSPEDAGGLFKRLTPTGVDVVLEEVLLRTQRHFTRRSSLSSVSSSDTNGHLFATSSVSGKLASNTKSSGGGESSSLCSNGSRGPPPPADGLGAAFADSSTAKAAGDSASASGEAEDSVSLVLPELHPRACALQQSLHLFAAALLAALRRADALLLLCRREQLHLGETQKRFLREAVERYGTWAEEYTSCAADLSMATLSSAELLTEDHRVLPLGWQYELSPHPIAVAVQQQCFLLLRLLLSESATPPYSTRNHEQQGPAAFVAEADDLGEGSNVFHFAASIGDESLLLCLRYELAADSWGPLLLARNACGWTPAEVAVRTHGVEKSLSTAFTAADAVARQLEAYSKYTCRRSVNTVLLGKLMLLAAAAAAAPVVLLRLAALPLMLLPAEAPWWLLKFSFFTAAAVAEVSAKQSGATEGQFVLKIAACCGFMLVIPSLFSSLVDSPFSLECVVIDAVRLLSLPVLLRCLVAAEVVQQSASAMLEELQEPPLRSFQEYAQLSLAACDIPGLDAAMQKRRLLPVSSEEFEQREEQDLEGGKTWQQQMPSQQQPLMAFINRLAAKHMCPLWIKGQETVALEETVLQQMEALIALLGEGRFEPLFPLVNPTDIFQRLKTIDDLVRQWLSLPSSDTSAVYSAVQQQLLHLLTQRFSGATAATAAQRPCGTPADSAAMGCSSSGDGDMLWEADAAQLQAKYLQRLGPLLCSSCTVFDDMTGECLGGGGGSAALSGGGGGDERGGLVRMQEGVETERMRRRNISECLRRAESYQLFLSFEDPNMRKGAPAAAGEATANSAAAADGMPGDYAARAASRLLEGEEEGAPAAAAPAAADDREEAVTLETVNSCSIVHLSTSLNSSGRRAEGTSLEELRAARLVLQPRIGGRGKAAGDAVGIIEDSADAALVPAVAPDTATLQTAGNCAAGTASDLEILSESAACKSPAASKDATDHIPQEEQQPMGQQEAAGEAAGTPSSGRFREELELLQRLVQYLEVQQIPFSLQRGELPERALGCLDSGGGRTSSMLQRLGWKHVKGSSGGSAASRSPLKQPQPLQGGPSAAAFSRGSSGRAASPLRQGEAAEGRASSARTSWSVQTSNQLLFVGARSSRSKDKASPTGSSLYSRNNSQQLLLPVSTVAPITRPAAAGRSPVGSPVTAAPGAADRDSGDGMRPAQELLAAALLADFSSRDNGSWLPFSFSRDTPTQQQEDCEQRQRDDSLFFCSIPSPRSTEESCMLSSTPKAVAAVEPGEIDALLLGEDTGQQQQPLSCWLMEEMAVQHQPQQQHHHLPGPSRRSDAAAAASSFASAPPGIWTLGTDAGLAVGRSGASQQARGSQDKQQHE
ncbi:transmembrane protein [Cyclospora cayetanensis]|uniref:Transmembrane protein n=1 Tax=Cyclospora cayetanensis TaxID=88456 RepID=A0A1D3CVS0_9EIME|nr:transmembrane protein [Cyclospora cayetanensis]